MTVSTIALIAVAALLVFIMVRVGWGTREAAPAQAAVSHAISEDRSRAGLRAGIGDVPTEQSTGRKRHGCC